MDLRTALSIAAAASVALAAGCRTIPEGDGEIRTSHALREEPHRAAVCVARNLDRHPARVDSRIRPGIDPVLIEVHVTRDGPVALAQFLVRGSGSTAQVTTTPELKLERASFVAAMLAGC